jgi:hypothetical protein
MVKHVQKKAKRTWELCDVTHVGGYDVPSFILAGTLFVTSGLGEIFSRPLGPVFKGSVLDFGLRSVFMAVYTRPLKAGDATG